MWDFFKPVPSKRTIKIRSKSGVIYNNPGALGKSLFHLGNLMLVLAVIYAVYLYLPLAQAMAGFWQIDNETPIVAQPTKVPGMALPTPTLVAVGTTEYSISVPRIGAFANIVDNVSPFDRNEYIRVLKDKVVAQAKGSSEAGSGLGTSTFIFAHSTEQGLSMVRQNSIFYLLGELNNGDEILIGKKGNILKYKVYLKKIVNASEVEYLKYKEPGREVLILQTCWPLGTDWKRLLVFGERVE
jgi:LPXTG-site transpeptidase (sortase) family protein